APFRIRSFIPSSSSSNSVISFSSRILRISLSSLRSKGLLQWWGGSAPRSSGIIRPASRRCQQTPAILSAGIPDQTGRGGLFEFSLELEPRHAQGETRSPHDGSGRHGRE